jgi:hypothetical protein
MSIKKYVKTNFDYNVAGLQPYVDEQREDLIHRSVTEAQTLSYIAIQQGIKGSEELKLLNDSIVYQTGDCSMSPSGDTIFTDRAISVETIGYLKRFCQKDLAGFWTQLALRPGAMAEDKTLPFEQILINYLLELHAFELEKLIWQGNKSTGSGNLAFMNGFNQFLTVANGCVDLNLTFGPTTIDATNAFGIFYEAFTNTPANIAEGQDFICFTGRENFNFLIKNLVDLNLYHFNVNEIGNLDEILLPGTNMRVVKVNGLNGTKKIYTGRASHFFFGTDLSSDFESYDLWYSFDDDVIYLRSKFRAGVQVPFLNQVGTFEGLI